MNVSFWWFWETGLLKLYDFCSPIRLFVYLVTAVLFQNKFRVDDVNGVNDIIAGVVFDQDVATWWLR